MTSNLYSPSIQYCDENGAPYAGGSLYFYSVGTFTPKTTYADVYGTTPLSNPVTLDASGRAVVYGNGQYRVILNDAHGVQIFDAVEQAGLADSVISAAMLPVVGAATLEEARRLMGIDDEIQAAIDLVNAIPGPTGPVGPVSTVAGPTGPTGPQGATGASAGLIQGGHVLCSGGRGTVTFSPPFSSLAAFVVTVNGNAFVSITYCANATNTGADIWVTYGGSGTPATVEVSWLAWGS